MTTEVRRASEGNEKGQQQPSTTETAEAPETPFPLTESTNYSKEIGYKICPKRSQNFLKISFPIFRE